MANDSELPPTTLMIRRAEEVIVEALAREFGAVTLRGVVTVCVGSEDAEHAHFTIEGRPASPHVEDDS